MVNVSRDKKLSPQNIKQNLSTLCAETPEWFCYMFSFFVLLQ